MKLIGVFFAGLVLSVFGQSATLNAQDIKAVYSGKAGFEMTLELTKEGHLRGETRGQEMWLLRRCGINYFVFPDQDGVKVLDLRIASKLMKDVMPDEMLSMDMPRMEFREIGEIEINGRKGIGYRSENASPNSPPMVVISNDPQLLPLRDAMLAQVKSSIELHPFAAKAFDAMLDILASGAPIQYAGAELVSFEEASLDQAAFDVPSDPLNEADSRSLMIAKGMLPEKKLEMPALSE